MTPVPILSDERTSEEHGLTSSKAWKRTPVTFATGTPDSKDGSRFGDGASRGVCPCEQGEHRLL